VDPSQRLGGKDPEETIVMTDETARISQKWNNAWFKDVNWVKLLAMEVEPPVKPKVKDIADISNFAANFTSEMISFDMSLERDTIGDADQEFSDFDFVASVTDSLRGHQISPRGKSATGLSSPLDFKASRRNPNRQHPQSSFEGEEAPRVIPSKKGEEFTYQQTSAGRQVMSEVPEAVTKKLIALEEKEKEKAKQHKGKHSQEDIGLGHMVVGARDLLKECKWDMSMVAKQICDTIIRKEEIDQCFEPKGSQEVPHKLQDFKAALDKFVEKMERRRNRNYSSGQSSLRRENSTGTALSDGEHGMRHSALRQRTHSEESDKTGSEGRGPLYSHSGVERTASMIREAAQRHAVEEAENARIRYHLPEEQRLRNQSHGGSESSGGDHTDTVAPLPAGLGRSNSMVKRKDKRNRSENDLATWLNNSVRLAEVRTLNPKPRTLNLEHRP